MPSCILTVRIPQTYTWIPALSTSMHLLGLCHPQHTDAHASQPIINPQHYKQHPSSASQRQSQCLFLHANLHHTPPEHNLVPGNQLQLPPGDVSGRLAP